MACLDKRSKESVEHGVVSAEKAEGFELMARFVRDVFAVQAVDVRKKEGDGFTSWRLELSPADVAELSGPTCFAEMASRMGLRQGQ